MQNEPNFAVSALKTEIDRKNEPKQTQFGHSDGTMRLGGPFYAKQSQF